MVKLKTIAGPCESLCGEAYVADLHVKNMGASHTQQGFDPLKEMDTRTCTHTTNKRGRREGERWHTAKSKVEFIS